MSGHISKESWSRCEQPSMLYDTVRNPSAPKIPPKPSLVLSQSKDTIETVQQRLNREMLERVHSKGHRLPHDSFVAVVQVGKYIFLAIMLPPYLCLYGIPRWMFMNLVPNIADFSKLIALRIGAMLLEFSKTATDLMKGMIEQTIGYFLRVNKDRFRRLWDKISNMLNSTRTAIGDAVKKVRDPISALKEKIVGSLADLGERLANAFKSFMQDAKEKTKSVIDYTVDPILAWFGKQSKETSAALNASLEAIFAPMRESYSAATRQIEALKQAIVSVVRSVTEPVAAKLAEVLGPVYRQIKESAAYLLEPLASWTKEIRETGYHLLRKGGKALEDGTKAVAEAARSAAVTVWSAMNDQVRAGWQLMPALFAKTGKSASRLLPRKVQKTLGSSQKMLQKWGQPAKRLAAGAANGVKEIAALAGRGIAGGFDLLKKLLMLLTKAIRRVLTYFIALPRMLLQWTLSSMKIAGKVARRLGFALQILIAVLWAFCLYGVFIARRITG